MFGWSARDSWEGREALCLLVVALCEMQCLNFLAVYVFVHKLLVRTYLIGYLKDICLFSFESACSVDIEYEFHQCSSDPGRNISRPSVQVHQSYCDN